MGAYDSVIKKMGDPLMQETTQDGTLLFTYVSMKIGFKNNKVVILTSSDSPHFVMTPRGIKSRHFEPGVVHDVYYVDEAIPFNHEYGNIHEPDIDGNTIVSRYYRIKSQDGLPALLIFQNSFAKTTNGRDDGIKITIRYE